MKIMMGYCYCTNNEILLSCGSYKYLACRRIMTIRSTDSQHRSADTSPTVVFPWFKHHASSTLSNQTQPGLRTVPKWIYFELGHILDYCGEFHVSAGGFKSPSWLGPMFFRSFRFGILSTTDAMGVTSYILTFPSHHIVLLGD